ncbi:unnamed protein product [Urochloa humidicola]
MGDGWDGVPADAFMAILLRIPLAPRRRLRLVCRHWRDVIDERTPPEQPRACAKVLVFTRYWGGVPARAYVLEDEPTAGGSGRELGNLPRDAGPDADVRMIGTCNGLLCCLRRKRGDVVVVDPATNEMVAVDSPRAGCYGDDESKYSFGYHPATGQYKIVHVPCQEYGGDIGAVLVFTLGARDGWREVPAPAGSSYRRRFGIVTIGGVSYWATMDAERIMSFDFKDERVAVVESPPIPVPLPKEPLYGPCHLTNVSGSGSVGLAAWRPSDEFGRSKTEVWVLEGGNGKERAWDKRYTVLAHGVYPRQVVARPHVVHGEHVLTTCELWGGLSRLNLNAHRPRDERKMRPCAMVRVGAPRAETVVGMYDAYSLRTFAYIYIETREPVHTVTILWPPV